MAKRKLKIAILNITQSTVSRGAEVYVKELAERLRKNHTVDIYSSPKPLPRSWPILRRLFLDSRSIMICLFTLGTLPKLFKRNYDVVLTVDGGWQPFWIRLLTWFKRGKLVISGQSGIGWDDRINLLSFPDRFIAISEKALNWSKKTNPFVESLYIPNGVDTNKFGEKTKAYKHNLRNQVVLCVGAFVSEKGIDSTIKAVSRVSNASLLLVGSGYLEEHLRKLGTTLLGERFKLLSVSHNEMPAIYSSADLFTLVPDYSEAFGIVFVEAMAAGIPVVASDDPIRREIIGDAGLFVDPTDTDAYVKALTKALKANWGDKPRRQAEKFDWDRIAKKYEDLFLDLSN